MLNATRAHGAAKAPGDVPTQLAALETMTVGQLAARYRELYGTPTSVRNKPYLRKRLAWRIQELAEGEPALRAMARVHERVALLGAELPERWRMRIAAQQKATSTPGSPAAGASGSLAPLEPRDPRVPPVGTALTRVFKGAQHTVIVCREGFEHAGIHFKTLSAAAKHITGVPWNGFEFFRINSPRPVVGAA
jgi:Protein of unknown function (DUF2924)